MERKTYSTRSNAKRAAGKLVEKLNALPSAPATEVEVVALADKAFGLLMIFDNVDAYDEAFAAGLVDGHSTSVQAAPSEEVGAAVDLDTLGLYGTGTNQEDAVCPHCGINHIDNGYQTADGIADAGGTCEREYVCLGCGGEWGPPVQGFAAKLASYMGAGKSKCASLRQIAHEWAKGDRKGYMTAAASAGIKPATASANWAAMRRGEW